MTRTKNAIISGIAFTVLYGGFMFYQYGTQHALISGPIAGVIFGLLMYFFVKSKTVNEQTKLEGIDEKAIIHSGDANHFKGVEAVGGRLYLLKEKLLFKSHHFNVQNHQTTVDFNQIQEVNYFNTLGFIPNGLSIKLHTGHIEKFVVNNRKTWKKELDNLLVVK
ncbi:hypothetical protein [Flammeovirga sp. EKP202]|uniref:hypothetical protein n=1 Tax=Flammeovirga sp. EKP202 TaxID=2770592 RepID=UPI00165F2ED6|nr:hypothetical protein [Flammeovirga sp. EKP202]MBD0403022.1 hypothetical protein [Flammeovirga sp. EKP202]